MKGSDGCGCEGDGEVNGARDCGDGSGSAGVGDAAITGMPEVEGKEEEEEEEPPCKRNKVCARGRAVLAYRRHVSINAVVAAGIPRACNSTSNNEDADADETIPGFGLDATSCSADRSPAPIKRDARAVRCSPAMSSTAGAPINWGTHGPTTNS